MSQAGWLESPVLSSRNQSQTSDLGWVGEGEGCPCLAQEWRGVALQEGRLLAVIWC